MLLFVTFLLIRGIWGKNRKNGFVGNKSLLLISDFSPNLQKISVYQKISQYLLFCLLLPLKRFCYNTVGETNEQHTSFWPKLLLIGPTVAHCQWAIGIILPNFGINLAQKCCPLVSLLPIGLIHCIPSMFLMVETISISIVSTILFSSTFLIPLSVSP